MLAAIAEYKISYLDLMVLHNGNILLLILSSS